MVPPNEQDPELDENSQDAGWFTPSEIDELPLHPDFRQSWNEGRPAEAGLPWSKQNLSSWTYGGLIRHGGSWVEVDSPGTSTGTKISDQHLAVKERPIGLHHALGTHSCEDCVFFKPEGRTHMDQKGTCSKFGGYAVEKDDMCEDWEKEKKHSVWKVAEQRGWTDFYHVSPRANRESIQNLGLMGDNGTSPWSDPYLRNQPYGNYMFDNPQDAENYAWNLKQRQQGSDPYEETPYTHNTPEDFHTWEPEDQDDWYDNNEPVERTEDPNGFDIWKVNTRNLPIHRDPESAITTDKPFTPGTLNTEYHDQDWPGRPDDTEAWQQQLNDHVRNWGPIPRRFYTPEQIEPERMQLHQHLPSWDMTEEEMNNRMDDPETTEQEVPSSWDEMQLRRPQFPAHSKTAALRYNPGQHGYKDGLGQWVQEGGRGLMTPEGEIHTWPGDGNTHIEQAMQEGLHTEPTVPGQPDFRNLTTFYIRPTGEIKAKDWPGGQNQWWVHEQIAKGDPRLWNGTDPNTHGLEKYDPETGLFKDSVWKKPDEEEEEEKSTEPQEVNDAEDHWPEFGEVTNEQRHHELQFSGDGRDLGPG